ncbi:hypothetical protein HYP06_gp088 [Vibrio phage vB_VspP_pVa5]|uniref:Uncharacterized protein n=1 Tax=Vibrio phage vB_VspP_pVa5 TaxID=1913109 RepID=A0A1J0GVB0_9CAUD|nr:hypothetical protein HYP06_gp088 [Vibrio phage vB_VspP_pVa5]APC46119.1 hypothetical protein vBVspPpVa5_0085 [Vibrio phage vB_VspP_pVa5]
MSSNKDQKSFEKTYQQALVHGFDRSLSVLLDRLKTYKNPHKIKLMEERIDYIRMRKLIDE